MARFCNSLCPVLTDMSKISALSFCCFIASYTEFSTYGRVAEKELTVICTIGVKAMTRVKKLKVTTIGDNLVYEEGQLDG